MQDDPSLPASDVGSGEKFANKLLEVLEKIERNPGLYIGRRCPIRLHSFLQGWLLGQDAENLSPLPEFRDWVAKKYSVQSGQSWAEIILHFSDGNVAGFKKFFLLFGEFLGN